MRSVQGKVSAKREGCICDAAGRNVPDRSGEFNLGKTDSAACYIPGHEANMQVFAHTGDAGFYPGWAGKGTLRGTIALVWSEKDQQADPRIQAMNPDTAAFIQPFHMVRPVPQSQIDAVSDKDVFTQNPGYQ